MTITMNPNLVIIANNDPYRMRSTADLLQAMSPDLTVFVKNPSDTTGRKYIPDFSRCVLALLMRGQSPSVLLVDHYKSIGGVSAGYARSILDQFMEIVPKGTLLPAVILFSGADTETLKSEAGIIRKQKMFPVVEWLGFPVRGAPLLGCIQKSSARAVELRMER